MQDNFLRHIILLLVIQATLLFLVTTCLVFLIMQNNQQIATSLLVCEQIAHKETGDEKSFGVDDGWSQFDPEPVND